MAAMASTSLPAQVYERLITRGIRGLSADTLAEIADFVYFLRRRAAEPEAFQGELEAALLAAELEQHSSDEWSHLEAEIDGYEQRFPRE